jgi:hypothetical protein
VMMMGGRVPVKYSGAESGRLFSLDMGLTGWDSPGRMCQTHGTLSTASIYIVPHALQKGRLLV